MSNTKLPLPANDPEFNKAVSNLLESPVPTEPEVPKMQWVTLTIDETLHGEFLLTESNANMLLSSAKLLDQEANRGEAEQGKQS